MTRDRAAPSPPGRRAELALRILLLVLALSTVNALRIAITQRQFFEQQFPGASGVAYYLLLATALAGLASLLGLWRWRRVALGAYLALGIFAAGLDVWVSAPRAHLVATILATLIVGSLGYVLRGRFQ